jgi:hypothetical protein
MGKVFNPGDKVAYAAAWLKSTGQQTGWAPRARGIVQGSEPFGVLDCNLTLVSRLALDAALAT